MDTMSWEVSFKRGIAMFKQEKYEDALKQLNEVGLSLSRLESMLTIVNKAVLANSREKSILDSRAAVLDKLDRPLDALKDSRKVINIAPESWQVWL